MSSTHIHPTAIVHNGAQLGTDVQIGPYCIVGSNVVLEDFVSLESHVVVEGWTRIGRSTKVSPFAVLGSEPQHTRYAGEATTVEIGANSIIRESATVHRGTVFGNGGTVVGENAYLMAYSHVAHDCIVGKDVILANAVQLAGHVTVEDNVTIGGSSAVAQFCRIGRYCYIGGGSILRKDLPPFMVGKGTDFEVQGINIVGLTRKGFSKQCIRNLKEIYKIFYLQGHTVEKSRTAIEDTIGITDEGKVFLDFTKESKMGYIR